MRLPKQKQLVLNTYVVVLDGGKFSFFENSKV
jgi:hypothetical protein